VACIISATSPDKPGALCIFIFFQCCSDPRYRICRSLLYTRRDLLNHDPFIFFIHQIFHILLSYVFNPILSTTILPDASFRQLESVSSAFCLPSVWLFKKSYFDSQNCSYHLKFLSTQFSFANDIIFLACWLLSLYFSLLSCPMSLLTFLSASFYTMPP